MELRGTSAVTLTLSPLTVSMMTPRRWLTWPTTEPWNSLGASISTFMMGSRMVGAAWL